MNHLKIELKELQVACKLYHRSGIKSLYIGRFKIDESEFKTMFNCNAVSKRWTFYEVNETSIFDWAEKKIGKTLDRDLYHFLGALLLLE